MNFKLTNLNFHVLISVLVLSIFIPAIIVKADTEVELKDFCDMTLEELMSVKIYTASKKLQKLNEAPASMEVITSEEIIARGYTNLEEVLHDLPGFNFSKANGIALSTIYQRGYRSDNTDRTILMIDGIPENDLWKGVAWLDKQYPLSNIKRIEVVYGPASALYGANAFQGVINVITKDGADLKKTVNFSAGYGSYNTYLVEGVVGQKFKDVDYILTVRKYDSDENDLSEYEEWNYQKPEGAVFVYPINKYENDKDDYSIHLKAKHHNFTFGGIYWSRRDGSGATYVDSYLKDDGKYYSDVCLTWNIRNMHYYGTYETDIFKNFKSFTRFTFMRHEHVDDSNDHYIIDGDSINVSFIYRHELSKCNQIEQQFSYDHLIFYNIENSMILGFQYDDSFLQGNYRQSEYLHQPGTPYPPTPDDISGQDYQEFYDFKEYGVFFQDVIKPRQNLSFTLGARYDYQRVRHTGGFGGVFNPRIGMVYFPVPRLNIKLLYGSGYSSLPNWTLFSTTDTRMANPTLPPEIVESKEAGIGYLINDYLSFETSFFYNDYKDKTLLIVYPEGVLDPDNPQITDRSEAVGKWRIWGYESRIKYVYKKISSYMNFSYAYPYDEDEKQKIGNIDHTVNFSINYSLNKNINLNLRGNYTGERNSIGRNDAGEFLATIDPYLVFHANVVVKNFWKSSKLIFTANNIFDTEYFDPGMRTGLGKYPYRLPQNGRNFFIRMEYSF